MAFYPSPEDHLWERERTEKLLSYLSDRQREVVVMRFGMGEEGEMTIKEISEKLGISTVRVRQIEHRALCVMEKRVEFVDSGMTQEQWDRVEFQREVDKRRGHTKGYYKFKAPIEIRYADQASRAKTKPIITDEQRKAVQKAMKQARAKTNDPMLLGLKRLLYIGELVAQELDVTRAVGLRIWKNVVEEERSEP